MALTADLVASVARVAEDAGPSPGAVYLTDQDYESAVRDMLAQAPPGDVWLFAYGSLLWEPAFEYVESRMATVRGWHRSFCIKVARFRGTRDLPGLMMALDRGGQCRGKVFRVPAEQAVETLETLFRRELVVKPPGTPPRWLTAQTDEGPLRAIGFVVDRRSPFYSGGLAPQDVAHVVCRAAGHWGCARSTCTTPCRTWRRSAFTTATCGGCRLSSPRGSFRRRTAGRDRARTADRGSAPGAGAQHVLHPRSTSA